MSVAVIVGSLAPYTSRLYDAYAHRFGEDVHLFSCAAIEPHRQWRFPPPKVARHTVLPGLRWHRTDASHVYVNPAIVPALARMRPDAIVAGAFSPTMLAAVAYARATATPYGIATDGTLATDPAAASLPHRLIRRLMVPAARFGVCGSTDSIRLLEHWGLAPGRGVEVPVVTAWDAPEHLPGFAERPFDILFASGVNEQFKGALFFTDVVARLAALGHRFKVRVVGTGPQLAEVEARLAAAGVEARIDGALQPAEVAAAMTSARLLMFPSRQDPWGLVANEAVLCGTPVLGSPHATSSPLFVERFGVGLVRPLEVDTWCAAAAEMLADPDRWQAFMGRRTEAIAWFALDAAVGALRRALELGRQHRFEVAPQAVGASERIRPAP